MRPTPSVPGVGRRPRRCIVWMEGVRRPWMPPPPSALSDTGDRWSAPDRPRAEFRLLGYLEVGDGDGAQAFGGPKQRALLAYLLLHAGEVVTPERLVDAIWGDEPPPTATAIVYGYVRKLRSALEATSATLSTRSSGYVLDIPGGSLDVAQFERLGGLGRQALRAGDVADARRLLGSALALWRGHALDGLDGEGFIRAEQMRLESLRLTTILGRIDADLRLGGAVDVVEELEALAREHPLDEGIRGQLMVALYRTGNQAEALAAYQDIRRALAEELGLDPSRSLQELEGAILRQDPSLDLPGPQTGPTSVPRGAADGGHGPPPRRVEGRLPVRRPRDVRGHRCGRLLRPRAPRVRDGRAARRARLPRRHRPVRQRQVVGRAGGARAGDRDGCPRRDELGARDPQAGRRADAGAGSRRIRGPRRVAAVAAACRAGPAPRRRVGAARGHASAGDRRPVRGGLHQRRRRRPTFGVHRVAGSRRPRRDGRGGPGPAR